MDSGLDAANPALIAAFMSALIQQLIIVGAIVVVLALGYRLARHWWPAAQQPAPAPEPRSRKILRITFGILWIFDGLLQAQPKMAGGLSSQVIEPVAAASPDWVQQVVNFGGTVWSYHPVVAAASAVWIQVGIGVWMLVARTGWSSRLAGLSGVGWGLIVWVFGESFGGVFAPAQTWLSGAPGAVILYIVAGALIWLPMRVWAGPRLGRLLLSGIGLSWIGFALVQAVPENGFWRGGETGTLTDMISTMEQVTQPHPQAAMLSAFARFTNGNAAAVNLFVVIALAALGAAFVSGRPRLLRIAVPAATVFCLADWLLVQDLGFPGGLGTDPNSMVPWVLLVWGGYVAVTERTAVVVAAETSAPAPSRTALRRVMGTVTPRSLVALGSVGVILLGAAPMAAASVDRNADPIIAQAIAGAPVRLDRPAPDFQLISGESGKSVDLTTLHGKVVLLTFLDPVCVGCPQIAQQLHAASKLLGADSSKVELVAIAATTMHSKAEFIRAFDKNQGLTLTPNWLFLTGPGVDLQRVWNNYEQVSPRMMSGMMVHSDIVFVIDPTGTLRWAVQDAPGPARASAQLSFAELLANAARPIVASSAQH
ncbi:MAG TPA: SCO family protein [Pseudonocardiaceae bacterium]|jgi:cytochrome oxidase Cu insertion factor (SCO1/SenC/PrrC family)|nr:SCO family protein [Pseudonocardiaceae bacterium]